MPHSDHSSSPVRETFSDLPTFSNNVPTAPLLRISLEKLLHHDQEEQERCWKACCDLGFFYLDLRTSSGQFIDGDALLQDAERLFEVMKGFFDLDVQEKVKYDFKDQGSYFGYKGYGEGVIDKEGTRDRNEFYNVRSFLPLVETRVLICVNADLQRQRPRP
jgi:isopenicillin N synthase-like dioxygenase